MIELADDTEDLPVSPQADFTDGFNNARRAHILRICRHRFPLLLRYLNTCYDSVAYLFLLDSGQMVGWFTCGEGSSIMMATRSVGQSMLHSTSPYIPLQKTSDGVPYAWIVDDCTLVPSRRRAVEVVRFIIEQGPDPGLFPNMSKFYA